MACLISVHKKVMDNVSKICIEFIDRLFFGTRHFACWKFLINCLDVRNIREEKVVFTAKSAAIVVMYKPIFANFLHKHILTRLTILTNKLLCNNKCLSTFKKVVEEF